MKLKTINKLIQDQIGDFKIVKNGDYFYVASDNEVLANDLASLPTTSIYVAHLNHQSTQDWIDDVKGIISQ